MRGLRDISNLNSIRTVSTEKVSSFPRKASLKKKYLELYMSETEKNRLTQELEMVDVKRAKLLKNIRIIRKKLHEIEYELKMRRETEI
ncbi:hypothetical protein Dtox_3030 [Desulfofarcimen acetoxidans DSM 771]|uniref:Uncharacterized protein n=1 Tax=Desulfofarcimen acetoxidans (strain ATCC 49208 / DSM 771 / KCTC 5769 / VKM B-1644 / 5575) TaxID=485916 RepID=C8W3J6_DESAS|nr:hypothetical protein [Desulfofarcimen acetoxidans]ACV63782.1 hypothetical protein Dtox_3030 [Desulfofarcimen acetoxidans DSM 771]